MPGIRFAAPAQAKPGADDVSMPPELTALSLEYSRAGALRDTPLAGLKVIRSDELSGPNHAIYEPSVCFVVQGAKTASVGNRVYSLQPGRFFVSSANLPVVGAVTRASAAEPYLALILSLDAGVIYEIAQTAGLEGPAAEHDSMGVFTDETTGGLTDAFLRLMRTLRLEQDRRVIAPLVAKEITYYLMQSRFSRVLFDLGIKGSGVRRIARSIETIRRDFSKPLKVEALARLADMSPSAFYENFRKFTALSPIQFQKQIRLQEARKLLATESADVTSVAYAVGYESPSQFSREYSRLFGLAPLKDLQRLRGKRGS